MKKIVVIGLIMLAACKNGDVKLSGGDSASSVALAKGSNSEDFSSSLSGLMSNYYELKKGFVLEDTLLIAKSAMLLSKDADKLPIQQMKADPTIIENAKVSSQSIVSQIQGLLGESTLENKRKDFQTLSEQLYDLIRIVQYDKEVVYHFTCSKAFDNNGANWLNNSPKIENPYLPKVTPACGDIIDFLDFRKK